MHADWKSTLASVSKWNSGKVNCAKNGKGLKIGTKEADTTRSIIGLGAFRKIKYFGDIPR